MGFLVLTLYFWHFLFVGDVASLIQALRIDCYVMSIMRQSPRKPPDPTIPPSDWKLFGWEDAVLTVLVFLFDFSTLFLWNYRSEPPIPVGPTAKELRHRKHRNRLLLLHLLKSAAMLPTLDPLTSYDSTVPRRIVDSTSLGLHSLITARTAIANSIHLIPLQLGVSQTKPVLQDTGASACTSPDLDDFEEGTLEDLTQPVTMDGIGGGVQIKQAGILRYHTIDDRGAPAILRCPGFYLPEVPLRLFSPQTFFAFQGKGGELAIRHDSATLRLSTGQEITMTIDPHSRLFYLHCLDNVQQQADELAFTLTDEKNSNLSRGQKQLLKYHHKLIHCAFKTIRHIGKLGWLGTRGLALGNPKDDPPMCGTCNFGKQKRTPTCTTRTIPLPTQESAISRNKLEPGDLFSMDHMVIRAPGRTWTSRGHDSEDRMFKAATVFVDSASKRVRIKFQRGLSALETIQSKMEVEKEALTAGRVIKSYRTDNGTFTAQAMMENIKDNDQTISFSGAGAQHQNAVAESAIRTLGNDTRTVMLHAALRWPEAYDPSLWPMAAQYVVDIRNELPKEQGELCPEEIFVGALSGHSRLLNARPWGCPAYVLEPALRDGGKIPKWQPKSRRGQFVGFSPTHASTVGLIRNLRTGTITPQFHCIYDGEYETVHASDGQPPAEWIELFHDERFQTPLDPEANPQLLEEWLSPEELAQRRDLLNCRTIPPPFNPSPPIVFPSSTEPVPRLPIDVTEGVPNSPYTFDPNDPPIKVEPFDVSDMVMDTPPGLPTFTPDQRLNAPRPLPETVDLTVSVPPLDTTSLRRSQRTRQAVKRDPNEGYSLYHRRPPYEIKTIGEKLAHELLGHSRRVCYSASYARIDYTYLSFLLHDWDTGHQEGIMPHDMFAFKAKKGTDPDMPMYHQAMASPEQEYWLEAMQSELSDLHDRKAWIELDKNALPPNTNIVPGTWAMKVKRYPDGRFRKFKARYCARGDKQLEGVDFFQTYAPVVAWSTVRMCMILSTLNRWTTLQADYTNAFAQGKLDETIYLALPQGCTGKFGSDTVLKLERSLYGLRQAASCWYDKLRDGLLRLDWYQPIPLLEPCLFVKDGIICLVYVDDCLFFGKDEEKIRRLIADIEKEGFHLTVEDDVYAFLGVEVTFNDKTKTVSLVQPGLILKIIKLADLADANSKATPADKDPLGPGFEDDPPHTEEWPYATMIGCLMYLANNTRPDIQYAVHACARYTHHPKEIHTKAVKRIVRYLIGTDDKGLIFRPTTALTMDMYVDADFAGMWNALADEQDPVRVKSRTGYVILFAGCPLLWVSKLQTEIATSTLEAEFIALSQGMRDLLPMRELFLALCTSLSLIPPDEAKLFSTVFEDNNGCLTLATVPRMTPRTKHIGVKYFWFRSKVLAPDSGIKIVKIATHDQLADIFTKGLTVEIFANLRRHLLGWDTSVREGVFRNDIERAEFGARVARFYRLCVLKLRTPSTYVQPTQGGVTADRFSPRPESTEFVALSEIRNID